MLPIVLNKKLIDDLFKNVFQNIGFRLEVDLRSQKIYTPDKISIDFEIDDSLKTNLLSGLDEIGQTLKMVDQIKSFEKNRMKNNPWLFNRPKLKK